MFTHFAFCDRVAVKCLCGLLRSVPHFNCTTDIIQVLVPKMACLDPRMQADANAAVRQLLADGQEGVVMVETVQLLADLVRLRKCVCPPEAVRSLLVLDFPDIKREDMQEGVRHSSLL